MGTRLGRMVLGFSGIILLFHFLMPNLGKDTSTNLGKDISKTHYISYLLHKK
ncbi:MAG: hypothetical protein BAJALOKI1v1_1490002 [Promethearchaeota archaeon]|nr:MAG: hypothetical protein BAJALOKI1v1_1490002 [Candidatus Lokiarchaeota archaeon]